MEPTSKRWTTVSDSPHDHEREALAFLRSRLYDRDPYRVWSNFEFVAPNGALYEVDALAVTDNGVHLIEIKSHPGEIGGDATTWQWTTPEGRRRLFDNPRLLANKKAKALREVLARTKAFAKRRNEVPYISEVVFLSDPHLKVTLSPPGRYQVYGRDPEKGEALPPERASIGGIIEALTSLEPDKSGRPRRRIDTPLGKRIARAVEQAGIRERSSRRLVGDFRIVELLDDVEADRDTGVAYQDFLARHVSATGIERRLRVYPLEQNATAEQRQAAERAARREFEHLHPLRLHPGIVAPLNLTDHERGPCLVFDHIPGEQTLDRWLKTPEVRDGLGMDDRLALVRDVAEAIAYAHTRGVFHRALCPSAIWVGEHDGKRTVRVANWHAGARVSTGDVTATMTGTVHVEALSGGDADLYRAPEHAQPLADPAALDVFSLGCLTAFVFTDEPPAPTSGKLRELLASTGHVSIDATGDQIDTLVAAFVAELTDVDPARRPKHAGEVLALLDELEEALTSPDPVDEPHVTVARRGSTLGDGRFAVLGRIGMGTTAFALLVRDTADAGRLAVLKVARTPEQNDRIAAEATALRGLRHPTIVELLEDEPLDLDGHAALLVSFVGDRGDAERDAEAIEEEVRAPLTLAARIGEPIGAELLQRWGEDLLDAVRYLEQEGVSHRDIKPENLGIAPRGKHDQLHLVLFDFSLAGTPVDRIEAGTQGYLDPFLSRRGRWDPAAERYAAAVVLYEMATGTKPVYGDGRADPTLVDAPLRLDPALFEPSIADGLVSFFERALAPEVADRFGTADDMLWAWRAAFHEAERPATAHPTPERPGPTEFTVPSGTTTATPLAGLPLSNRALNALEREEILTVGDLLEAPLARVLQMRGVGNLTRNELRVAVAALRAAVGDTGDEGPGELQLAEAAELLVPRSTGREANRAVLLRAYLGLDGEGGGWPTQAELAQRVDVTRQRVSQVLASARQRWSKQPTVTRVRDWLASELAAMGGVASLAQLADRLADAFPPVADDAPDAGEGAGDGRSDPLARAAAHRRAAVAMVRASLVVEGERAAPRFVHRVLDPMAVVVALEDDEAGPSGQALADFASALVDRTTALLAERTVVPSSELVAALRDVEAPEGAAPLADAHLAEMAASLTPTAAVNSRLELYRRGLSAAEAVGAARRALVAVTDVTVEQIAAKVRARFPEAEPLPGRPALDQLLRDVDLELRWNEQAGRYESPALVADPVTSMTLSRHATGQPTTGVTPVEIDVAADFHDRLRRSIDAGGLLVLVTDAKHVERAADELARFPVTTVDVDDWLIGEIERLTASGRPSWDLVVQADAAGPGSTAWHNLRRLIDRAADALTERLAATSGTVLLVRPGLLARYDRLDLVGRWRDVVHDPGSPLAQLWLLVPSPAASDGPILSGRPVAVTSGEWVRVPAEWLRNAHGTAVRPGGT